MGKTLDLGEISQEEQDKILQVLKRDDKRKQAEELRLSKIRQEIDIESIKRNILVQQSGFNEKCCILCCSAFNFLFNKKYKCDFCEFQVCRNCVVYDGRVWICKICEKHRSLYLQSYHRLHCNNNSTVHFASAKLLKVFLNQTKVNSCENAPLNENSVVMNDDTMPGLFNCSDNQENYNSHQTEDPVLIEVREHIEVLVEGLLGASLDNAHVDIPYSDQQYTELLVKHKDKLSLAILDLTRALYLSTQNKPIYDNNTPTQAHAALKELITKITNETLQLPHLLKTCVNGSSTKSLTRTVSDCFNSYEELLATAIINQLVEVSQARFRDENCLKDKSHSSIESDSAFGDIINSNLGSDDERELRKIIVENPTFVLEEQIEEITTKSYSDEKLSDDECFYPELDAKQTNLKVAFPEAGIDFVDFNENQDDEETRFQIRQTDSSCWQENWLFQKSKRVQNAQQIFTFNSLNLLDNPVSMLIPNPSQIINTKIGTKEIDEISEISENNSVGSFEISDSENEDDMQINEDMPNDKESREVINKPISYRPPTPPKKKYSRKPVIPITLKVPHFTPKNQRNDQNCLDPIFLTKPGDASVQSGILIQFCCQIKGAKPLQVAWFRKDSLLSGNDKIRIFKSGNLFIFEIKKTSLDDSDCYSCVAYNSRGHNWVDFKLIVSNKFFVQQNNFKKQLKEKKSSELKKHDAFTKFVETKPPPLVIERTWAERVIQMQKSSLKSRKEQVPKDEHLNDFSEETATTAILVPTVAMKEHNKWQSAVEWPENPYTFEKNNERIKQGLFYSKNDSNIDEDPVSLEETDPLLCLSTSKDLNRYKKQYYTPEFKEETFRSFDENIYINSKLFEINKNEVSKNNISTNKDEENCKSLDHFENEPLVLPSVKDLVSKFSKYNQDESDLGLKNLRKSKENLSEQNKQRKSTTSQPNYKVHSLTARSMSKEFRQMTKQNIPRALNKISSVSSDERTQDADGQCQKESNHAEECQNTFIRLKNEECHQ